MSEVNRLVVADRYRLSRVNGKFSLEHKILDRKGMKVLSSYVEDMNDFSLENGWNFIIDKAATMELPEKQAEQQKARAEAARDENAEKFVNAISEITKKAPKVAPVETPKTAEYSTPEKPLEEYNRKELVAFLKANNVTFQMTWADGKLLEVAKEVNNG
jgi:hypothetical protein